MSTVVMVQVDDRCHRAVFELMNVLGVAVQPMRRGLRLLCLDGGGSAAIASVEALKQVCAQALDSSECPYSDLPLCTRCCPTAAAVCCLSVLAAVVVTWGHHTGAKGHWWGSASRVL